MKHSTKLYFYVIVTLLFVQFVFGQDEAPAPEGEAAPPPAEGDPPPAPAEGGAEGAAPPGEPAAPAGEPAPAAAAKKETIADTEFRGPSAWLRICEPGANKFVGVVTEARDECPGGYWFHDTIKIGCACGHGVWVFAKGWCDHSAKVIVARNGSCFNVNKDVKYIKHIGWSNNAFMPYHFAATSGMEYVQYVPDVSTLSGGATYFHHEYNQHLGAINRAHGIESMTGRVCYSHEGNVSRTLAMKYFVPKLPYMQKLSCFAYAFQDLHKFEYDAGYNVNEGLTLVEEPSDPFEKPAPWTTPEDATKCATECPAAFKLSLNLAKNNSLAPDYVDPLIDEYFLEDLKEMGWNDTTSFPTSLPDQNCSRQYTLTNKTVLEIQEQTKRILQLNLVSSVANGVAPNVFYHDYKLLQKARAIFDKVCPEEELPSPVLTGMLRMFRVIVNESFDHYPFEQVGDDEQAKSILEILGQCDDQAKPMTFIYDNMNVPKASGSGNDSENGTDPVGRAGSANGECEVQTKFLGVQYDFKGELNRTILARLPCHLWTNVTDLDLVIETAWKTVMFAHYYCARHFNNASARFSTFEQKLEKFFNRWIQHRWFYPGSSFSGYSYLYQMYNLTKFAVAMDRCVAAARSFSVYRKWLQRPVYLKFLGGRLFEEQYDIPDNIAGRTKFDAINPKRNKFADKAYCLPYWHAPASNPGLNYKPEGDYKPGCVMYRKEEWENPYMPASRPGDGWKNTVGF